MVYQGALPTVLVALLAAAVFLVRTAALMRMIGSLRRERLAHVSVLHARQLRRLLIGYFQDDQL